MGWALLAVQIHQVLGRFLQPPAPPPTLAVHPRFLQQALHSQAVCSHLREQIPIQPAVASYSTLVWEVSLTKGCFLQRPRFLSGYLHPACRTNLNPCVLTLLGCTQDQTDLQPQYGDRQTPHTSTFSARSRPKALNNNRHNRPHFQSPPSTPMTLQSGPLLRDQRGCT